VTTTFPLNRVIAERTNRGAPSSFAKAGSGGPRMPITIPPGLTTDAGLAQLLRGYAERAVSLG
jgi:hypothetical protein